MSKAGVEFTPGARRALARRDEERCARCGRPLGAGANGHHRKLRSRGGLGNLANGILLCGSGTTGCHGWAHREIATATEQGYVVSRWGDERTTPVLTWRGWVTLDDEGDWHPAEPPER